MVFWARKLVLMTWGCEALALVTAVVLYSSQAAAVTRLPFFGGSDLTPQWFDRADQLPADYHRVTNLSLQDQNGKTVTDDALKGKITLVTFFYTTCPTLCPRIVQHLKKVQTAFKDDKKVMLLSISVTPELDNQKRLQEFARHNGMRTPGWVLARGPMTEVERLAKSMYFVQDTSLVPEENPKIDHSDRVVLVDQAGHLRGVYRGTRLYDIERIIRDVGVLKTGG